MVSRVTSGPDGKLWFSYESGVGRVAPDGTALRRWAEPFGGSTDCDSNTPLGVYDSMAFDATGALWASDSARHSLLRLSTRAAAQPSPLEPLVRAEGVFARRDAIARGPDGSVWISAAHSIVRFNAAGRRTVFRRGVASRPGDLLPATDGSVWYTVAHGIDHLSPSGRVHHYRRGLPRRSELSTLARGPDGNIWFVDHGARAIGRMTGSGRVHEYVRGVPRRADIAAIAADRRYLWVTDGSGAVLRVSTRGRIRRFTRDLGAKADPFDITRGPDGAMWLTEFAAQRIARITQAGRITTYPVHDDPAGITSGPDGALWFTTASASSSDTAAGVGRITTQGAVNQFYAHMTCSGRSRTIATGPDAKLWFIEPDGPVAIGRLSPQQLIATGALSAPKATPPLR